MPAWVRRTSDEVVGEGRSAVLCACEMTSRLEWIGRRENLVVCGPVKPSRSNVRRRRMIRPVLGASGQRTPIPNRNYLRARL